LQFKDFFITFLTCGCTNANDVARCKA